MKALDGLLILLLLAAVVSAQQIQAPPVHFAGPVGPGGPFPFFNSGTITLQSDDDYTLKGADTTASVLRITTAAGVSLSTTRNIIAPQAGPPFFGYQFTVENATAGGQNIVVKGNTGTGVTIPNGQAAVVFYDGTNYVSAGGGGGPTVPGGAAGEVVFNGVSDAVEDLKCSTVAGTPNLTCSDAPFSVCPSGSGKVVDVTAGILSTFIPRPGGYPSTNTESLITTIQSCPDSSHAIMEKNATNTTTNTAARWGTDNGPALIALANAPSTAGKIFKVPPGNYLVQTTEADAGYTYPVGPGHSIDVYSNTTYHIMHGAHIYWVGPKGCTGYGDNDPNYCLNPYNPQIGPHSLEMGNKLFYLHDHDYWTQNGTKNVHIQIDGIIEGSNTFGAAGSPMLNQTSVAFWVGIYGGVQEIGDILIDGSGSVINTYGFSFHGISGYNLDVRGLTFVRNAKGLNVNGYKSDQSFNSFSTSAGIEACGSLITIIGNKFDDTWGISVGGIGMDKGQEGVCTGYVVANNVFHSMRGTNLDLSQCPIGAVIANNSFDVPPNINPDWALPPNERWSNAVALSLHDGTKPDGSGDPTHTRDNLIIGNTFFAEQGDGTPNQRQCYAAVSAGGDAISGNVFVGNKMAGNCVYGYSLSGRSLARLNEPNIIRNDSITNILIKADSNWRLEGTVLNPFSFGIGGTPGGAPALAPGSWYTYQNGMQFDKLTITQEQSASAGTRAGPVPASAQGHAAKPKPKATPKPKNLVDPSETKYFVDPLEIYQSQPLDEELATYVDDADSQAAKKPPAKAAVRQVTPPLSAPPAHQRTKPPFLEEWPYPLSTAPEEKPPATRAVPRSSSHTSAFRILSPNQGNYLDINVPNAGNPSIVSSTGGITVSGLTGGPGDGGGFAAGGDLAGSATTQQVQGIFGKSIPALATGYLRYNGTAFEWAAAPTGPSSGIQSINGDANPAQTIVGTGPITVSPPLNGVTTIGCSGCTGGGDGGIAIPQSAGVLIVTPGAVTPPPPGSVPQGFPNIGDTAQDLTDTLLMIGFHSTVDGTVNGCSAYIGTTATGKVYCMLYDSDNSNGPVVYLPGTLLCTDSTGSNVVANSWNQIASFQAGSCPPLVANHYYYIGYMIAGTATSAWDTATTQSGIYFYTSGLLSSPCCTAPPFIPAASLGNLNNPRSIYLTVTPAGTRSGQAAGRQATPRSGYTLDTTLGTGYLHYDGTNYSWDAGGGGTGNVWSVSNTYPMSATAGATVFTQTMVTPAVDSNYYLTWQLQQVNTGSGGTCNAGALGVVLGFTEAVSNAPITAYISGRAFNAPGGTNSFSAGTTIDATNYFVGFPFEFTAKGNSPVTFSLTQTTASNCSTGQQFALRAHLKAW